MWNCTSLGTGQNEAHFCNIYYWSYVPFHVFARIFRMIAIIRNYYESYDLIIIMRMVMMVTIITKVMI